MNALNSFNKYFAVHCLFQSCVWWIINRPMNEAIIQRKWLKRPKCWRDRRRNCWKWRKSSIHSNFWQKRPVFGKTGQLGQKMTCLGSKVAILAKKLIFGKNGANFGRKWLLLAKQKEANFSKTDQFREKRPNDREDQNDRRGQNDRETKTTKEANIPKRPILPEKANFTRPRQNNPILSQQSREKSPVSTINVGYFPQGLHWTSDGVIVLFRNNSSIEILNGNNNHFTRFVINLSTIHSFIVVNV